MQTAVLGCNETVAVLPWKPWRNLEPSGSSSGVYSLYPPTKRWLKTLRPTRGPGEDPVLLRCPSTWGRHSKMSILKQQSYISRCQCGSPIYLESCQSFQKHDLGLISVQLIETLATIVSCFFQDLILQGRDLRPRWLDCISLFHQSFQLHLDVANILLYLISGPK